ncbi:hypothetical protein LH20_05020 [Sphingopyxis sp. 113P3]|nr:hypothetical protein LH20_05020 [Sphingopyxis sp. 113P3]
MKVAIKFDPLKPVYSCGPIYPGDKAGIAQGGEKTAIHHRTRIGLKLWASSTLPVRTLSED